MARSLLPFLCVKERQWIYGNLENCSHKDQKASGEWGRRDPQRCIKNENLIFQVNTRPPPLRGILAVDVPQGLGAVLALPHPRDGDEAGSPLLGTMGTGRFQRVLQKLPGQSRLGLTVWCTGLCLVAFPSLPFPVGIPVFFQTLGLAFISLLSSPLFLLLLSKMNGEQRAN